MAVIWAMGALLAIGVALTVWWGATAYRPSASIFAPEALPIAVVARRYVRGAAVAVVGGFGRVCSSLGPPCGSSCDCWR